MTNTTTDLIARLEKAEPGRELDALIECEVRRFQAYALGLSDEHRSHWNPVGAKGEVIDHQGIIRYHAPLYTHSIDAALMLVPDGFAWLVRNHDKRADFYGDGAGKAAFANVHGWRDDQPLHPAYGATPAIALCIAALKAREAVSHD